MKGVHAYCTKVAGPVNALRLQLESLKKQIAKIEEGKGLVGKVKCHFIISLASDIIIMSCL